VQALRAQGLHQTLLGTSVMDTRLTLGSESKALEGTTFTSYGFPRESAAAHRFAAHYRTREGHGPVGGFPALGLETVRLLQAAARKARSAKPSAIQRALEGGLTLEGVGLEGRAYRPGGDHNPVSGVAISRVSSGSLLELLVTEPRKALVP